MQNQCYGGNIYAATKYAQKGLAEVLRWELMPYNIRVHAVCPGFVDTPMSADGTSLLTPMLCIQVVSHLHEARIDSSEGPDQIMHYGWLDFS